MFLGYMLFMSVVSVVICILDFNYVLVRVVTKRRRRNHRKKETKALLTSVPETKEA